VRDWQVSVAGHGSESRDERAELAEPDTADQLSGRGSHVTVVGGATEVTPPSDELIDANDVLKALKAFVEENNKQRIRSYLLTYSFIIIRWIF